VSSPYLLRDQVLFVFESNDDLRKQVAHRVAAPMFFLSFLFLAILATVMVVTVDAIRVETSKRQDTTEAAASVAASSSIKVNTNAAATRNTCLIILGVLWPIFWVEFAFQFITRDRSQSFWSNKYYGLVVCLIPPLRLCARNPDMDGRVWLPGLGWQASDDNLRKRLDHLFSIPMIIIALTILPILLIEFLMTDQIATRPWLRNLLHVSMGVIWFAFAVEFIVMVSVAEKKLRYCKEHWIDLAIILLPLISFLRSLRVIRATRLARVAKVQQLTKMGRLYRLRGLAMRALRAVLLLELLHRIFGISEEKKIKSLRAQLEEKEREVADLKAAIHELERRLEERGRADQAKFPAERDVATEEVT
jgi:voltage-gated potassium channel